MIPLFGRRGSRGTTDFVDDVEPVVESPVQWVTPQHIELASLNAEDELAALTASKPIAQLRSLLGWLGSSRPITGKGVPRPGSVSELAKAVGVELNGRELGARSMLQIKALMTLWDAAKVTGLIELHSTRAVPGPHAQQFAHSHASSLAAHRRALSHVIGRYFFSEDPLRPSPAVDVVAGQIVLAAMTSTPRTQLPAVGPAGAGDLYEHIEALILRGMLEQFIADGWLVCDGNYRVPQPFRPAVLDAMTSLPYYETDTTNR
ncbi:hypothetical protein CH260_24495 [Rhodococcus sp. 05-2256-B2]|uniref:hypothetical protein n=1 Tax=Rhodococcoides fascians TaxID=1828 RepID=UPI00050C96F6|nr:hypothetical protein [Rhodococcus fascians]OZD87630.1 hypothetical protein CH258_10725 [Rhodococcus sp. 05-2256-B4]OZD89895.1 hypothetical protein CH260_24495 [Rhodococcus sp. 05-2256-B2]OZD92213.1 hypothetical protein CH257_14045 [Rhodococcus sp. 05-2256-B3]OZD98918.1 hypothetical protein CH285_22500 [Rhodococcus sp. 05-2256-B1]